MNSYNKSLPKWDITLPDPLNYAKTMMTSISGQVTQAFRQSFLAQSQAITLAPKDEEKKDLNKTDTTTVGKKITKKSTIKKKNNNYNEKNLMIPSAYIQKNYYLLRSYQKRAQEAVDNKKVFLIYDGYYRVVDELKKRGWIEKLSDYKFRGLQEMTQDQLLSLAAPGNDYETTILSNLLYDKPPNFIWQPKGLKDCYDYMLPYRNRIRRSHELDFTTKEGIIACTENSHWNTIPNIAEVHCPRYHRLAFKEEIPEFLEDFRITSCLSLLIYMDENGDKLLKKKGRMTLSCVYFATERVLEAVNRRKLENLDVQPLKKPVETSVSSQEWGMFSVNFRSIVYEGAKFKGDKNRFHWELNKIKGILKLANQYWPTLHMDGCQNAWILKPAYSCRGRGIRIMKDYSKIVSFAASRPHMRYIVQKYIERPLLIHRTKFDIRQYVLITINNSYNIWMYRECYLRFSSQEYTLYDLSESVHITNNSVQRKYKNGARSSELPHHNMWHSSEYEQYLATIGMPTTWQKIYRGMQKNLIAIFLASLEGTDFVQNAFELFGCDFMIDENYDPVLIEINATPDMSPSTTVTRKICQQALADVIKVVVDHSKDSSKPTGGFELVYKVPLQKVNAFRSSSLRVNGQRLRTKSSFRINPLKYHQSSSIMRIEKSFKSIVKCAKRQAAKTDSDIESVLKLKNKSSTNIKRVKSRASRTESDIVSELKLKNKSSTNIKRVQSHASKAESVIEPELKLKNKSSTNIKRVKSRSLKPESDIEPELKLKNKSSTNIKRVKSRSLKPESDIESELKLKNKSSTNIKRVKSRSLKPESDIESELKPFEIVVAKRSKATIASNKTKLPIKSSPSINPFNLIEKSLSIMKIVNENNRKKRNKFTMGTHKKTVKIAKFKHKNVKTHFITDIMPIDALKDNFKNPKEKAILLGFMDIISRKLMQPEVRN